MSHPYIYPADMKNLGEVGYGYHTHKTPVRVIRIWETFSFHTHFDAMINFLLLDAKNDQYWAVADMSERERIMSLLCEGLVYYISNFKLVNALPHWKPIQTDTTIVFDRKTTITDFLDVSPMVRYRFDICSLPKVAARVNDSTHLNDVAGVLIHAGDLEYDKNCIKRLDLTLVDNGLALLHISLWGLKATLFKIDCERHRQKNLVLVITGLLSKNKGGRTYLSSTQATSIFYDPICQEVHNLSQHITDTYGEFICKLPQEIEYSFKLLKQPGAAPPCLTVQQLLQAPIWMFQKFLCNVTIIDVLLRAGRHTGSCIACRGCVSVEVNRYYCSECGRNFIAPIQKPCFNLHVEDTTGRTRFVLQRPHIKQLTGYSRAELLQTRKLVLDKTNTFPAANEIISGAHCTFQVILTPSSYSNTTGKFIIDKVIQYTRTRPGMISK